MSVPLAVLFDLDGVLIESRAAITSSMNHSLAAMGEPQRDPAELEQFIGPPQLQAFTTLLGAERAPAAIAAYREHYARTSLDTTTVMPGMDAVLARVAAAVPVGVATSKVRAFALPLCEHLGLMQHLTVLEGPALDARIETKGQTIARALHGLGLGPGDDVPMVGDRSHDVEGAHANALRCVGVLWGIGDRAELQAAGADAIVASPAELPAALGI
jgi:phosphoglycolate phosphatase